MPSTVNGGSCTCSLFTTKVLTDHQMDVDKYGHHLDENGSPICSSSKIASGRFLHIFDSVLVTNIMEPFTVSHVPFQLSSWYYLVQQ